MGVVKGDEAFADGTRFEIAFAHIHTTGHDLDDVGDVFYLLVMKDDQTSFRGWRVGDDLAHARERADL